MPVGPAVTQPGVLIDAPSEPATTAPPTPPSTPSSPIPSGRIVDTIDNTVRPPSPPAPDNRPTVDRYRLGPVQQGTIEAAILSAMGVRDRVFTPFHAALHAVCFDLNARYQARMYPRLDTANAPTIPAVTTNTNDDLGTYRALYAHNLDALLPRVLPKATPGELAAAKKELLSKRGMV